MRNVSKKPKKKHGEANFNFHNGNNKGFVQNNFLEYKTNAHKLTEWFTT